MFISFKDTKNSWSKMKIRADYMTHMSDLVGNKDFTRVQAPKTSSRRKEMAVGIVLVGVSMLDGPSPIMDVLGVIGMDLVIG